MFRELAGPITLMGWRYEVIRNTRASGHETSSSLLRGIQSTPYRMLRRIPSGLSLHHISMLKVKDRCSKTKTSNGNVRVLANLEGRGGAGVRPYNGPGVNLGMVDRIWRSAASFAMTRQWAWRHLCFL